MTTLVKPISPIFALPPIVVAEPLDTDNKYEVPAYIRRGYRWFTGKSPAACGGVLCQVIWTGISPCGEIARVQFWKGYRATVLASELAEVLPVSVEA